MKYHLGDILSVTTGLLVSPRHISGVAALLEYMAGEPVWTHQLPRVADECKPALLEQHPQLARIVVPDRIEPHKVAGWLAQQVDRFGEHLEVQPLAPEDHTSVDPIAEFRMKAPDTPIIAIEARHPQDPNEGVSDAP